MSDSKEVMDAIMSVKHLVGGKKRRGSKKSSKKGSKKVHLLF